MIPLSLAPQGIPLRVVGLRAGKNAMRRLTELGFSPGTVVRIIKSLDRGPLLIEVKGSRIALGRGIGMKVLVEVAS